MNDNATICAVSTPPGRSGIGIVRLSGPDAVATAEKFFEPTNGKPLSEQPARRLVHGHVTDEGPMFSREVDVFGTIVDYNKFNLGWFGPDDNSLFALDKKNLEYIPEEE